MEDFTVRRRNRLRHHYTLTSNVLLFGYKRLPDGAKLTYQVIDSFDWGDSAGLRKGYAFPSLATLANIRGVNERTLRRHLADLESARLMSRQSRPGRPNLLVIEDPSPEETQAYLETFPKQGSDEKVRPTPDRNVRPLEEGKEQERQRTLTRAKPSGREGESGDYEHISHAIREKLSTLRASKGTDRPDKARRDHLAQEMVRALGDPESLGYYRRVAARTPSRLIYEALGKVKELAREGRVRRSRGAAFVALMDGPRKRDHDG